MADKQLNIEEYVKEQLKRTKYGSLKFSTIEELVEKVGNKIYDNLYCTKWSKDKNPKTHELIWNYGAKDIMQTIENKLISEDEEIPDCVKAYFMQKSKVIDSTKGSKLFVSLMGDNDTNEGRIERRIQWVRNQLKKFEASRQAQFSKDNRFATKSYKDVRYNRLAELLSKSMLMWQPVCVDVANPVERGRNKLTGLNYRRLVDFLASYNSTSIVKKVIGESVQEMVGFDALKSVLAEANLINSETTSHPFLSEVLMEQPKDIESLYHSYLSKELEKLKSLKQTLGSTTSLVDLQAKAPAFVHPYRERWSLDLEKEEDVQRLASNYMKSGNTILLPDGLFTDAIINRLKNNYPDILSEASTNERNNELSYNVSYFISRYLELKEDNCQSFYMAATPKFYRGYEFFKEGSKDCLFRYMSHEEIMTSLREKRQDADDATIRRINKIRKNERVLLRYKIQDVVLFLTARKMLQNQLCQNINNVATRQHEERINLGTPIQTASNLDPEKISLMKSKDIFDGSALDLPMNYEYKMNVQWNLLDEEGREVKFNKDTNEQIPFGEDGKPKEKGGVPKVFTRIVYVTQNNVAIKNFGRIFRAIKDPRTNLLLQLLIVKREKEVGNDVLETVPVYTVSAAELLNEFAQLEAMRSGAFVKIHGLEKIAYPKINENSSETFQFKNMMRKICEESKAVAVNQYRISFAHGIFGVDADTFGNGVLLSVPNVSEVMEEGMNALSDDIVKEYNNTDSKSCLTK